MKHEMASKEATVELYGLDGDEHLTEAMEDVVGRVLDDAVLKCGESFSEIFDRIEWPIKIHVFRRMIISDKHKAYLSECLLEDLLDRLDAEYGDPDGDGTKPTDAMKTAATSFVDVVVGGYCVWTCEQTGAVIEISREQAKEYE